MITASSPIDMQSYQIKNLAVPTDPNDAVNRLFVEQLFNNRSWKDQVRVAVNSNINIASPGANLDSLAMNPSDPVLLFGQSDQTQNGVYVWNGAAVPMTRRSDADGSGELRGGATFAIQEGSSADKWATLITDGVVMIGTTPLQFTVMSNSGAIYTGTSGIQVSGTQISVLLDAGSGLIATPQGLKVDPSIYVRKFAANVGNGSATSILVAHNLGTLDVQTALFHISTKRKWIEDVELIDVNSFNLHFGSAPAANALRLSVQA